jgi:aldose 1-epimerase
VALALPALARAVDDSLDTQPDESENEEQKGPLVTRTSFGKTPDGTETSLFTCTNAKGASMQVTDYGARLVSLRVPDRQKQFEDVTLGFDSVEKYVAHTAYFGCTTGRFANRIGKGRFKLDGKEYKLATNNGPNHLHGGVKGFDRQVWKAEPVQQPDAVGVKFSLESKDGDEGYPGTLEAVVTLLLTNENDLKIHYVATTDKPTVLNLTNHAYWNLAGAGAGEILAHRMQIPATHYLAVDDNLIPTGTLAPVKGTFMDFLEPQLIGSRIEKTKFGSLPVGYDHCYVLKNPKRELVLAASVEDPGSGRVMEVRTTEPAVQFYTGNFLDGDSKNGGHKQHTAFCLETQHYPDSPNRPEFPSVVLRPGAKYESTTVYTFKVK